MFGQYSEKRRTLVLLAAITSGLWSIGVQTGPVQGQEPDPTTQLYVSSVHAGWFLAYQGRSSRQSLAIVDIVDGNGDPVNGALVVGDWSGCFKRLNDSDTTETVCTTPQGEPTDCVDGRAAIWGKKMNCPRNNCVFTFTITNVQKDGMTYVPVSGKTSSSVPCNPLSSAVNRGTKATLTSSRQVVIRTQSRYRTSG